MRFVVWLKCMDAVVVKVRNDRDTFQVPGMQISELYYTIGIPDALTLSEFALSHPKMCPMLVRSFQSYTTHS